MQQTDKYKLNKPGVDDPIAIATLNENADRIEAALLTEAAALRADAAAGDAALEQRIATLELHKVAIGSYVGIGGTQFIDLGFTPRLVIGERGSGEGVFAFGEYADRLECVEGGFNARNATNVSFNFKGSTYHYIAFA